MTTSRPSSIPAAAHSLWFRLPAAANAPNRSSLVWVMGQEDARRRAGARRRSACAGDRASGAIAARRHADRRRARALSHDSADRAEDRRRTAGARRRRGACPAADRRARAQSRLARRRGDHRLRGRSARARGATLAGRRPCAPTSARGAPTSRSGLARSTASTGRCSPALRRSISRAARAWRALRGRAVAPPRDAGGDRASLRGNRPNLNSLRVEGVCREIARGGRPSTIETLSLKRSRQCRRRPPKLRFPLKRSSPVPAMNGASACSPSAFWPWGSGS